MSAVPALIDLTFYEQNYYVTTSSAPELLYECGLEDLTRPEGAAGFVRAYAPEIKALSPDVASTYFASWLGRLGAAYLYGLWHDGVELDLRLERLSLQMCRTPRGAALSFRLNPGELQARPVVDAEWPDAVHEALSAYYSTQIRPVVEAVAAAGGVPAGSVWGLMATGLYYILDQWRGMVPDGERRNRLEELADLVVNRLEPQVFGRSRNPFQIKFRLVESLQNPEVQVRLKGSCCLAYKTDTGHGYCYTCPKISEDEREQMRQDHRTKQQAHA
ncbi:(2Fe-2S)-binding protein [Gorillibacterium sp. sgz5001074]|uniref:(2Fe-2S)-binding protein n=1 Tax=Gorillibacterium sp. sgz5001074 TaxID=3446695 RepID=UPI003F66E40A